MCFCFAAPINLSHHHSISLLTSDIAKCQTFKLVCIKYFRRSTELKSLPKIIYFVLKLGYSMLPTISNPLFAHFPCYVWKYVVRLFPLNNHDNGVLIYYVLVKFPLLLTLICKNIVC